ncbi:unknown [Feldmannia species virus]|uniref:Uncharacterized protein n=1 Tax=Feldmannia species virus TaxID=39420 RepID=B5LWK2_9PHYC|nr:hypothetical protein FeldSpV_gp113 [Feldmannia species virus]ACH46865.1 unknown [Feldmannia species virus]
MKTIGSRANVFHGTARKTSGGLVKGDLKLNKNGSIVSKKNSLRAKRTESPLLKAWRKAVKNTYEKPKYAGKFCIIKKGTPFYREVNAEYQKILKKSSLSR